MGAETEGIQVAFGANIAGLTNGLTAATSGVKDAVGSMEGHFKGLAGVLDNLKAPFLAFTGLLAGGALFKGVIGETIGWTGEVAKLARQLGITTQEASGLAMALGKLGIDSDTYGAAVFKLQIALRTQEEELNRNGIATRNSKGEHLAIQDVMMGGIKRLGEMNKGFDANALSMLMWGRGAKEMQGLMRLTNERIAEGTEEAKKLGKEVSGAQVQAMRSYKESLHEAKEVFEAIQVQIGAKLLPTLTSLGQWFASNGPAIIGPTVKMFEALAGAMSYTTVQLALLTAALWGPLSAAWAKASTAVMAFAQTIRVQMALGAMEGVTGIRGLIGALQSMINPWVLAGVVIVAAGVGLERWISSASRAAEASAEMANKLRTNTSEFLRLGDEAQRYDDILRSSKSTDEEKKRAQDKLAITLAQLNAVYPGFNRYLTDEAGNHRSIAEALRLANAERQKSIELQIRETQGKLAEAQQQAAERTVSAASGGALGQFGGIWSAIQNKRAESATEAAEKYEKTLNGLRDSLKALKGEDDALAGIGKTGATFKDKPKDTKEREQEELRAWKDTLTQKLEAQGAFFNDSTNMSLEYWRGILDHERLSKNQRQAINHEVFKLEKDQARQSHEAKLEELRSEMQAFEQNTAAKIAKQRDVIAEELRAHKGRTKDVIAAERELLNLERQLEAERQNLRVKTANANRDIRLAELEGVEGDLKRRKDLNQVTGEQELAAQVAIEDRRYAARKAALQVEMDDLKLTAAEREQLRATEAVMELDHQEKLKQIRHQATMDSLQNMRDFLQPLTAAFQSSLEGLLAGTMSWSNAVKNLWKGLGQVLDQMIVKMVMSWVTGENTKTAATQWGVLKRIAAETAGALQSVAIAIWTGLKWIAIKGYEAAAGAYAAISSIPFVGPFLAPAVAAGVLASVIGLGSKVASAAGGWETVPHDQMAMIHKDEQVLPASYASGLRQLIKNGGPGQQQAPPQEIHQHTWNVQAMDASSFEDFLMNNQSAMVRVQRELVRNGRMG